VQKKALEKAVWNTVNPVIDLAQIHAQSLPTLGIIKQDHPNSVKLKSKTCRTQSCGSKQCAAARACDTADGERCCF